MKPTKIIKLIKKGEGETVEFKKAPSDLGRVVCALANTSGGVILVGVDDSGNLKGVKSKKAKQKIFDSFAGVVPAPEVSVEDAKIGDKTLFVIKVSLSDRLLSFRNVVYIRVGGNNRPLSITEILEKSAESLKIFFDEQISKAKAKKADKKLIRDYLVVREKTRGVKTYLSDLWESALQIGAAKYKKGDLFLTNAGLLFFTKNPADFYSFAKVRLVWFEDEEMKNYRDKKEFSGPLPEIVENLEKYWLDNLKVIGGFRTGFKRGEFLEYPLASLREALINALVHRNYFDASEVVVFVFPNRIEIKNPGSFPPGVTVAKPEHKPRNPTLCQYMYDLGFTEKYGGGIFKIKKECQAHPLVKAVFKIRPFSTRVVFEKKKADMKLDKVNEEILQRLRGKALSSGQISRFVDLSRQAVVTRLNNLKSLGFIKREGRSRGVKYRLV